MNRIIFLVACAVITLSAGEALARGGARVGGGRVGVGVAVRPGAAIQRTPSMSRAGAAAVVGYRAGAVNSGAYGGYSGGYYYPTTPYYPTTAYPPGQPYPYAIPGYNPV